MTRRLNRAVAVLLRAWYEGYGAPPVGSLVYEGLRDLEIAVHATDWVDVRVALPPADGAEYGDWRESKPVLASDGIGAPLVARYVRVNDGEPCWITQGRLGYTFEGVTHWQELPAGPA